MRIPVLITLPAQEPLVESATASLEHRAPQIPYSAANLPPGAELDTAFPAVPIGPGPGSGLGQVRGAMVAAREPSQSQEFAVRALIEVDSPEEIPVEIDGRRVFAEPQIAPFPTCGGTPPVGASGDAETHLKVAQLAAKGLDGDDVAIVIMDTGINLPHLAAQLGWQPRFDAANSWTPPGLTSLPGKRPVDHGTMCAFNALLAAPRATLVDFPILSGSAPGGAAVSGTLSTALNGFSNLLGNWAVAFAPGGLAQYRALVVNNSWGLYHPSWDFPVGHPGRFIDNPSHPFNLIVRALTAAGADVLFAAGNCGSDCADGRCQGRTTQTIMGANALEEVLTVAGCDVHDQRVGYSSQGPSIAGMFQEKPDLTTYTHFLGSEAFGPGSPDSGTSTACPVAAGCVAALRTQLSPATTPPANLIAQLKVTARPSTGQTGWNGNVGHGFLDPLAAAGSFGL